MAELQVNSSETASATAARRMVEHLLKQEADAADPLGDIFLVDRNEVTQKGYRKHEEAEITVCECVIEDDNPESACGDQCLNMMTCTECTPGYCISGELCRNQRFQRCEYAQTKLIKTDNRGWGLAAAQDLKAGDFVIEYCGEVITQKEAHLRTKTYESAGRKDCYIMDLNGDEFIDATHVGNMARFINHSCDPNCETSKWTVLGEDRIGIFAITDIDAGTELTYDYNFQWFGANRIRCLCGANSCGGFFGVKAKNFQIQKDPYAWEDDTPGKEVEEARLSDAEDDDAPLSSYLDPGLISRKYRGGVILKAKNAGASRLLRGSVLTDVGTSVKKESNVSTPAETTSVATPSYTPAEKTTPEKSMPVRRKGSAGKKDKPSITKGTHLFGRFKDSKLKKLGKILQKTTSVDTNDDLEEGGGEIPVGKKRPRFDVKDQRKKKVILTAEQLLSENAARVTGFQVARVMANKQLFVESPYCFPVSEAACAEVEFAQEVEMASGSDFKKVCEEIQPIVRDYVMRDALEDIPLPINVGDKWMEARCKRLRSSLTFHFAIIRHLAGPTFALCGPKDSSS